MIVHNTLVPMVNGPELFHIIYDHSVVVCAQHFVPFTNEKCKI